MKTHCLSLEILESRVLLSGLMLLSSRRHSEPAPPVTTEEPPPTPTTPTEVDEVPQPVTPEIGEVPPPPVTLTSGIDEDALSEIIHEVQGIKAERARRKKEFLERLLPVPETEAESREIFIRGADEENGEKLEHSENEHDSRHEDASARICGMESINDDVSRPEPPPVKQKDK